MTPDTYYLGIDVGSVSTNLVVMDENGAILKKLYLRTSGQPIKVLCEGLNILKEYVGENAYIGGVGATGSGRRLVDVIAGADIVKNEITTHAVAAQKVVPDVRTIIEIGGQDSKIIFLKDGIVYDFAMNTVCAAGTGSFLDRQAERLGIPIAEMGKYALRSKAPVRIAGRCAVFAESDMIHKQQAGYCLEDIICGLCEGLVRNYLNNLAKGKDISEPVVFQGGVAANIGIVNAFRKTLQKEIIIPEYYDVMGAYGAALIAKEKMRAREIEKINGSENIDKNKNNIEGKNGYEYDNNWGSTVFKGFKIAKNNYTTRNLECCGCPNMCEVLEILSNGNPIARWGDKCGKWGFGI